MDQSQNDMTFEQSIRAVMQTLPPVLRKYLADGKYTPVAKSLAIKYGLHIDQAGVLEREIMLILMGIENPEEFAKSLTTEASIPEGTVRNIMTDVNAQIFVPLREQMKSSAQQTAPPPLKATHTPSETSQGTAQGTARPAAAPGVVRPPIARTIPANPQMPSRTFPPASTPLPPKPPSPQPSLPPPQPDIESSEASSASTRDTPLGQALRTALSSPPPPNLPGVVSPPSPPVPPTPKTGFDPYRESIDEK